MPLGTSIRSITPHSGSSAMRRLTRPVAASSVRPGGAGASYIGLRGGAGGSTSFRVNAGTQGLLASNPGSKLGFWAASRSDSGNMYGYRDGALIASVAQVSTAVPTGNMCLGRVQSTYDTSRFSVFFSGAGLTNGQMAALHARLATYLAAIGA